MGSWDLKPGICDPYHSAVTCQTKVGGGGHKKKEAHSHGVVILEMHDKT